MQWLSAFGLLRIAFLGWNRKAHKSTDQTKKFSSFKVSNSKIENQDQLHRSLRARCECSVSWFVVVVEHRKFSTPWPTQPPHTTSALVLSKPRLRSHFPSALPAEYRPPLTFISFPRFCHLAPPGLVYGFPMPCPNTPPHQAIYRLNGRLKRSAHYTCGHAHGPGTTLNIDDGHGNVRWWRRTVDETNLLAWQGAKTFF